MKPLIFTKILSIVCVLLSGYASAEVAHPEDPSIVGGVFGDTVCFNSDGGVNDISECDGLDDDEGMMSLVMFWWAPSSLSGINGCGVAAVNPVSSATCPLYLTTFSFVNAPFDKYVLVQTTGSGHYWAVLANGTSTAIATPETKGLVPCRTTDAFDPVNGCASDNPPVITVEDGYIKLGSGREPPASHCTDSTHVGRMVVDGVNDFIYVCTPTGWSIR